MLRALVGAFLLAGGAAAATAAQGLAAISKPAASPAPSRTPAATPKQAAAARPSTAPPKLRLPDTVRPTRGAIDLFTDPAEPRYRGTVRYQVTLTAPTAVIWLHAEGLELGAATVGGKKARLRTAPGGLIGLSPEAPLPAGSVEVVVEFSGAFDRALSRGLYAVAEGERWYAYTFFEPSDARRAFPCFDEPSAKIPWRLSLHVKPGDLALANARIAAETAEGTLRRVDFEETKPLPAYLVAFVVGPFDLVDGGAGGAARVPIRFVVPKGRGAETRYAAEVTPRILDALEAVIGRPYPYDKCDVAVVPRFWGTMEHPGLVALGQPLTLILPAEETRQRREAYANTAIHELAHHWYGDLVTHAWWDDVWLNESFGTWEDANVTERLEPGWRALVTDRWERRAGGLEADVLPSAKRLRQPVASRHDIEGSFDNGITYSKGASLLTMYEGFLGPARFRAVVQAHLDARVHGVATADDFLVALSASAGPEAAVSFRGFLEQPGVPRLEATVRCGLGGARVSFTQERFLATGPRDRASRWKVPVCVRAGAGEREATSCGLVGAPSDQLALPFCPEWLWPNAGGLGYYLTALSPAALPGLLPRLSLPEKLALTSDAELQARRGDLPMADALGLVAPLAGERDRLLVTASTRLAGLIDPNRLGDADLARWRSFARRTWGERARALGWLPRPDDDEETRALRALLLPLVAGPGEEAVLAGEAQALARRWLADRRQVPAEVAWPALQVAARRADKGLFERIVAEAGRTTDRTEKGRLFAVLGGVQDPALARAALALLLAPGNDRRDTGPILSLMLSTRASRRLAWSFLTENWTRLAGTLRADEGTWLISTAAEVACEPGRRAEVAGFLRPRAEPFDGAPRALASALEEADACAAARARNEKAISAFLTRATMP
jgi:aminopeptidase N